MSYTTLAYTKIASLRVNKRLDLTSLGFQFKQQLMELDRAPDADLVTTTRIATQQEPYNVKAQSVQETEVGRTLRLDEPEQLTWER